VLVRLVDKSDVRSRVEPATVRRECCCAYGADALRHVEQFADIHLERRRILRRV